MCKDNNGMTPLHSVCCSSGNFEVIRYLIEECDCDPMSKIKFLETPLHLACDSGHYDVAEYLLLCTCNVIPDGRNFIFMSPGFKIKDNSIKSLLKGFSQYSLCLSTDTYINVLLLGNSGVGKSTLTEVIKQRSEGGVWFGQYRSVSSVEPLTATITLDGSVVVVCLALNLGLACPSIHSLHKYACKHGCCSIIEHRSICNYQLLFQMSTGMLVVCLLFVPGGAHLLWRSDPCKIFNPPSSSLEVPRVFLAQ